MKKFGFLLSLLLIIEISKEIEISPEIMEIIYDKITLVIKGMTTSEKGECYNMLINEDNKKFILSIIPKIISEISQAQPGQEIFIILNYIPEIIQNLNYTFLEYCQIENFIYFYTAIQNYESRVKKVEEVGRSIIENNQTFFEGTSQLVKTRGIDGKIVLLGKIISAVTNITFGNITRTE